MCGESARLHCVALAEVAVVVDDADAGLTPRGEKSLRGVVDRTVRHHDHLDVLARQACCDGALDDTDVVDDSFAAVVDGHDDRQQRA
jgi:hypothetical protein